MMMLVATPVTPMELRRTKMRGVPTKHRLTNEAGSNQKRLRPKTEFRKTLKVHALSPLQVANAKTDF